MKRVPFYSLQGNNTSCSFLQPEKFSVCEIRQQRSNFPAAPGCIWPSLCCVCVDLVLNKDLTRVSIWSRKIHQNLEGRNLGPSDQCAKSPSMEEAVCVPSAAQQGTHRPSILALSTSSLPLWPAGLRMEMIIWIEGWKMCGQPALSFFRLLASALPVIMY